MSSVLKMHCGVTLPTGGGKGNKAELTFYFSLPVCKDVQLRRLAKRLQLHLHRLCSHIHRHSSHHLSLQVQNHPFIVSFCSIHYFTINEKLQCALPSALCLLKDHLLHVGLPSDHLRTLLRLLLFQRPPDDAAVSSHLLGRPHHSHGSSLPHQQRKE